MPAEESLPCMPFADASMAGVFLGELLDRMKHWAKYGI